MPIILLLASSLLPGGAEPATGLRLRPTTDATQVEVVALLPASILAQLPAEKVTQAQGERWLRLALVDEETGQPGPPIFGTYQRRPGQLVFTPRYPLVPDQCYRATLELPRGKLTEAEYRVPAPPPAPRAVVEKVYPSTDTLPANQLKFYLHFSRPMRESREVFDRIQLLDAAGKPVEEPWRRTELWSADRKRLTLWIHPGRIKQGVNLREEFGPVLHPGREYRLVIGAELLDDDGRPLARAFTKKFRTGPEDRERPLPERWQVRPPLVDSRRPLVLEFPRPLDRALLDRFVTVLDAHGQPVAGRIEVGAEERSWAFHPARPWQDATYRVKVDGRLEDLAGNTPVSLFDVDLAKPAAEPPRLTLEFRPRKIE